MRATDEDGRVAIGNPDVSLDTAIEVVHWTCVIRQGAAGRWWSCEGRSYSKLSDEVAGAGPFVDARLCSCQAWVSRRDPW